MKHIMNLNDTPYNMIKSGRKTIELRLYDEKRRMISIGDEIEFVIANNDGMAQGAIAALQAAGYNKNDKRKTAQRSSFGLYQITKIKKCKN